MKAQNILKTLIIAIALYTSVKVSAQSSAKISHFRFKGQNISEFVADINKSHKKQFLVKRKESLKHNNKLNNETWNLNAGEWLASNQDSKMHAEVWMLNSEKLIESSTLGVIESDENINFESWMFDANEMARSIEDTLDISSNYENWMFDSLKW